MKLFYSKQSARCRKYITAQQDATPNKGNNTTLLQATPARESGVGVNFQSHRNKLTLNKVKKNIELLAPAPNCELGETAILMGAEGNGRVILFSDNPNFRGTWYGSNKVFLNALFFGGSISVPAVAGEE